MALPPFPDLENPVSSTPVSGLLGYDKNGNVTHFRRKNPHDNTWTPWIPGNGSTIAWSAYIHPSARFHVNVTILDGATIEEDVSIGAGAFIGKYVKIGPGTFVEASAEIGDLVKISHDCRIGYRSKILYEAKLAPHVRVSSQLTIPAFAFLAAYTEL